MYGYHEKSLLLCVQILAVILHTGKHPRRSKKGLGTQIQAFQGVFKMGLISWIKSRKCRVCGKVTLYSIITGKMCLGCWTAIYNETKGMGKGYGKK